MRSPPKTNEAISEGLPGAWQSANHFPLTRYKSGNTKKLSASPSRDRSIAGQLYSDRRVARQNRRVLPLSGRRSGVFEPAIKAVAVSKKLHAAILPIKNATRICESAALAKDSTHP
jgi:hypothetical protein